MDKALYAKGRAVFDESASSYLDMIIQVLHRRKVPTLEEKWAEISERRNALERRLRVVARSQLAATYGWEDGARELVAVLPPQHSKLVKDMTLEEALDADQ